MRGKRRNVKLAWCYALILALLAGSGCTGPGAVRQDDENKPVAPSAIRSVAGIDVRKGEDNVMVGIHASSPLTYTSVKQVGNPGLSLYFPETILGQLPPEIPGDGSPILRISSSQLDVTPPTVRIDIDLSEDMPYEVLKQENDLNVILTTQGAMPKAPKAVASASPDENPSVIQEEKRPAASVGSSPVQEAALGTSPPTGKRAWLNRIDFSADDSGVATITLGTTQPVAYRVEKVHPTQVRLRLEKTRLSENRKYPLITDRFQGAVNRIVPTQAAKPADTAYVTIDLRESVPYRVEQNGNLILLHFDPSIVTAEQSNPPSFQDKQIAQPPERDETAGGALAMAPSSMPPQSQPQPQPTMVNPEKKQSNLFSTDMPKVYTGEKIAIDFFDTDIRNVFKIIAEISGKNFAIDPAVTGKISLTLEKPVPWDQVLDMVLRMNGLDKVEVGDIIRISTVAQLQKEQEAQKNLMIAEKASQAQMVELEPLVTAYLPINYAKAADEMKPHLDGLLTPGRGTLTVDARTNQLIMTDVPAKIRKAKEIIQKLDRVTPQVVIEAKIVEASTDFSRDLGVTWDAAGGIQGDDARAGIGPQKGFDVLNGTHGWDAAVNFPITSSNNGQIGINFTKIAGTPLVINARLYAMEQNNQGRIVSSPKILTLDNKEAFIEQGVEVGYTEKGKTDEVPSVKFKKVTLNLKVTPHVTLDNRISMKIELVKDDILSYYQGVPTINTKKAATELLVDDGDTLVIGGITKTSEKESESGVPGLAKIPLLGWLFKTKSDTRTNEELLIFMTPRIVQLEQRVMINDPGKG
jgi:type IV pilus assembly protein PilQ